ncbi:hypothetical protein A2U01_0098846, partial [Trifolium medium]|nr:hypothetical protein [Trifolium medium]
CGGGRGGAAAAAYATAACSAYARSTAFCAFRKNFFPIGSMGPVISSLDLVGTPS